MNFEKVELYGFKSFADKAEIKFGNGITGIVGPNGCGTSNVADAIRWVLGEQSAKSLRGSSMSDVIFSGTQGRKSLSYCEVSLFFDNSNKMFSIDYNEVIITRKLYRSGESEYFINKQPARLKDIIELLHECGIGKEGYTIIGQGKVEEIMSAKPEDRRMIFEEATGIAKFKTRKNESERKLERTRENIIRYVDILSEIENQLGPLERQAEKAREYNELTEQLKFHELNTYVAKVDGVEEAKGKINVKIKGIEEQTSLRQSEYDKAVKEYDKIFSDIENADVKLRDLNEKLLQKRVSMEKSSGAQQLYKEKISYFLSQIERAKNEIKENQKLIEESKGNLTLNETTLRQVEDDLKTLNKKAEELSAKIVKLNERIALGEELAANTRKKVIESIENLSDIKMSTGAKNIERENLIAKIGELTDRLDALSVKREQSFNDKEKCDKNIDELDRAVFEIKNQIDSKEDEVRDCNEKVAGVENKIYSLNSVITTLVTKDNFYRGLKESYEGYAPAVKLLLNKAKDNNELKKRILGVVAELIKSDKKYDVALETALASAAQNIVTATPDDARYLLEYLKVNKFGRATCLPITSVKPRERNYSVTSALNDKGALGVADEIVSYDAKFTNVISSLLGNTLIVDTLANATDIAKKYHFAFKIVTLDGDVLSPQGAMTGGSRRNDAPGLLSNDRKIEDNAEQLKVKRAEMDELKQEKTKLEALRDKVFDELSMLNDMYNGKRQQVVVEREKQKAIEQSLSDVGREIENVNELISTVEDKLKQVSLDYEEISKGGIKLEKDRKDATE
ncbi:MAG: chromosome segregation protein SMC, partial [Clostridia bacterium]|nr:chromosome segregation protein SMC [Clostridia bacterium]